MKNTKLTILFMCIAGSSMAQSADAATSSVSYCQVMLGLIIALLAFVLFLLVFTLQKVVQILKKETLGETYTEVPERGFWEKVLDLKPLAAEKDVELDHDYDGIKELNNPIPFWFNLLFYGTIFFGFIYMLVYFAFDAAPLQAKEYEIELAEAKIAKEEYVKKAGNLIDESNVVMLADASQLSEGATLYTSKCAVCHGDKGEGKVGPNLTDVYWLHGGDIQSVFKTIKYGVPSKGMVAWQNSMNGMQMQQLASYVLSLQGTNPPGAKEPQGEAVGTPTVAPTDSSASATADSTVVKSM
ncbi:MAG: c-type cytochrome [Bacteroidia bacterium]|jgi:cytochrome c oxidase cbb3-type subunit 3|nr:c-type cytochrome [Bacteroidia bacterium]